MGSLDITNCLKNVYATDNVANREAILRARLNLFGIIIDTVADELGQPRMPEDQRQEHLAQLLFSSAIRDLTRIQINNH